MTKTYRHIGFLLFFVGVIQLSAAEVAAVISPAKRQASLDAARKILSQVQPKVPSNLIDPFNPTAFAATISGVPLPSVGGGDTPTAPAGPRSEQSILQAIAKGLKPSGYFVIDGQPILVFGQKKVKAGSFLSLTFEGNPYTLEIAAIDHNSFTLRLNREEFTRPIR